MLQFEMARIPIVVHWTFWLSAVLLGDGLNANSSKEWIDIGIWTVVMFASILVHELGHALMARRFGAESMIQLHGFGGVTFMPRNAFTRRQHIWVSAAGPMAGLCLGASVFLAAKLATLYFGQIHNMGVLVAIDCALQINFIWSFINLLPIQPMDGGQILRDVLGPARYRTTCTIGTFTAIGAGIYALNMNPIQIYLAVFMFYFAYLNYVDQAGDGGVISR